MVTYPQNVQSINIYIYVARLRPVFCDVQYVLQVPSSPFSPKMLLSLKKLLDEKIFKISFSIKKVIFIFVARHPLPFKRDLDPRNGFLLRSQKIQPFLKEPLSNEIFRASFVIKKVILTFGARRLLSLKNRQMCLENSFSRFPRKILLFSKKLTNTLVLTKYL